MTSTTEAIGGTAKVILGLIELIAKQMGEPVADVRKRVLAEVKATAKDPSDETDPVADAIDADLPASDK